MKNPLSILGLAMVIACFAGCVDGEDVGEVSPTAPAADENGARVTARNYVRAESDFQMKSYIEKFDCFGKLGSPTTSRTSSPFGATGTRCTHSACST